MTWTGHRPVRCQLCGEWFPDADAAWDHECAVWEGLDAEERARSRPVLPQYRMIAHHVDRFPLKDWRRRWIAWGDPGGLWRQRHRPRRRAEVALTQAGGEDGPADPAEPRTRGRAPPAAG